MSNDIVETGNLPVSAGSPFNSDVRNIFVSITPGCTEQISISGFSTARYSTSFACEAFDDMYEDNPGHAGGNTQPAAPMTSAAEFGPAAGKKACTAMTMDFTLVCSYQLAKAAGMGNQ